MLEVYAIVFMSQRYDFYLKPVLSSSPYFQIHETDFVP